VKFKAQKRGGEKAKTKTKEEERRTGLTSNRADEEQS
jgi:hypothetical protein